MRFMKSVGALSERLTYSFTHVDYASCMAQVVKDLRQLPQAVA